LHGIEHHYIIIFDVSFCYTFLVQISCACVTAVAMLRNFYLSVC